MDFLDILREKAFLGREFLTWLWFRSDVSGGRIEIPGKKVVEVIFLDRMTLDLSETETPQSVTLKGEQSQLREGLAALKEGKKIEEARLSVRVADNEYSAMVKGTWLSFSSFRTPPILPSSEADPDEGFEAMVLEKIALVEEGLDIMDLLFEYFISLRISEAWEGTELPALKKWVKAAAI